MSGAILGQSLEVQGVTEGRDSREAPFHSSIQGHRLGDTNFHLARISAAANIVLLHRFTKDRKCADEH